MLHDACQISWRVPSDYTGLAFLHGLVVDTTGWTVALAGQALLSPIDTRISYASSEPFMVQNSQIFIGGAGAGLGGGSGGAGGSGGVGDAAALSSTAAIDTGNGCRLWIECYWWVIILLTIMLLSSILCCWRFCCYRRNKRKAKKEEELEALEVCQSLFFCVCVCMWCTHKTFSAAENA